MRGAFILCVLCLSPAFGGAPVAVTLDSLAAMRSAARSAALLRIRDSDGAPATLHELEMAARQRVEARRELGLPPFSAGCLTAGEFELDAQLGLARQAADAHELAKALDEYRHLATELDDRLADARRTNAWRRHFPALRRWEREWRGAKNPRTRELFLRTLNGQAIRAALARIKTPAPAAGTKRGPRSKVVENSATLAAVAYREYIFNLMCANDEENLRWFKRQVAEIGWFGQKEYGWAADQAALLIVQHADADPGFQESVVAALWPRLEKADTDPENFAYLVDRVAVRAGRPQSFGTQMECVNGAWMVPEIQDQDSLDDRRRRMNLVAYGVQIARTRGLCRD